MVRYLEETPQDYSQRLEQTWEVEQTGDALRLHGPCPTCGHESESCFERITASFSLDRQVRVTVVCGCAEPHYGRPEGKHGCGRGAPIVIELDP